MSRNIEKNESLEKRIDAGCKFFKNLADHHWDSNVVKKYMPEFIRLVKKYRQKTKDQLEETFSQAQEIFKT